MEYVVIGLLVVLIILVTISLFRKNDTKTIERLGNLELSVTKDISTLKEAL